MVAADHHRSEDEVPFLSENISSPPPSPREASNNVPVTQFESTIECEQSRKVSKIKRRLYISHFLSTWNSRVFEFGAVLMLAHMYEDTLLPASLYALVRAASAICLSPMVGRYIDREERLAIVRRSIVRQRIAVILSCPGFWLLGILRLSSDMVINPILFTIMTALACVEKFYSIMNLVAIERDWVVVIAESSPCGLGMLNAQMRRIDLVCKLFGPLMIAFVDARSMSWTIEVIFGMSVLSLLVEYFAIAYVYRMVPALRSKQPIASTASADFTPSAADIPFYRRLSDLCFTQAVNVFEGLTNYSRHVAFLPSFALCLLYLTVLSFSGQMVAYLVSVGFTSAQIGLLRTISTAVEVSATWLAPMAMGRVGLLRSGLWFINWQMTCLLGATASFWLIDKPVTAASVLVAGMIASRVGLWGFDLCVQIIVQEEVEAKCRGSFSSIESSFQNLFELCSYISTIVFARPDQFRYPVSISAATVLVSGAFYAYFVRKNRGHLLHLSKCVEGKRKRANDQRDDVSMQDLP